jgi:hypothetical protein
LIDDSLLIFGIPLRTTISTNSVRLILGTVSPPEDKGVDHSGICLELTCGTACAVLEAMSLSTAINGRSASSSFYSHLLGHNL